MPEIASLGLAVDSRQVAQGAKELDTLTAAASRAEQGARRLQTATDGAVRPIVDHAPKAAEAIKGTAFQTANLAAQLQDIAVQMQSGQNPFQIALQQGSQITQVIGQQGAKGAVQALGAAFTSLINPVSLATVGIIAFGGFAIQALASMIPKTESATEALDRHAKELRALVAGYKDAGQAVDAYVEAAQSLPRAIVQQGIAQQFEQLKQKADEFKATMSGDSFNFFGSSNQGTFEVLSGSLNAIDQQVGKLGMDFAAGKISAEDLAVGMDRISRMNFFDPLNTMHNFVIQTRDAALAVAGLQTAYVNLEQAIAASGHSQGVQVALDSMLESKRSAEATKIELDALKAKTPAQQADIAKRREAMQLQNEEMTDALRKQKIDEAGQIAYAQAAASAEKAGVKQYDAYQQVIAAARQRTDQANIEAQALGMTEAAAARLTAEHELLAQAEQAGVTIDAKKRAELIAVADAMADAQTRTKELTKAQQEQEQQAKQMADSLATFLGSLFTKPITDAQTFFDTVLRGFASIAQSNFKTGLETLFDPTPANDNGSPSNTIGKGSAFMGGWGSKGLSKDNPLHVDVSNFNDMFKNIPGGSASTLQAGLGGLSLGYQTQSPVFGALGGALQGGLAGAAGGPAGIAIGAVIGGLGGLIGGFLGMNEALEKAKQAIKDNTDAINAFIATGFGNEVSKYATALAQFNEQGQKLIDLAKQAGDNALVDKLNGAIAAYPATLAKQLQDDLDRQLNSLNGTSYLNDIADAQKAYNQTLADGALLGIDVAAKANDILAASLKKIATDANLTASQILVLAAQFPTLAGSLNALIGVTGGPDLEQLQQNVDDAQSSLRDAYNEQASLLKSTGDAARQASKSIRDFIASMDTGSLSPLSPYDQLQSAAAQFAQVSQGALAGNADDVAKLTDVSQEYLDAAKGYYASSEQYFAIFDQVKGILGQVANSQDSVASTADMQLAALNQQVGSLISIDNGVKSVADAIAALAAAQGALAAGQAANQNGATPTSAIDTLYQTVLGRPADAAGEAYWTSQVTAAGGTLTPDITRAFIAAGIANGETVDPTIRAAYGMANGGWVTGGVPGTDSVPRYLMPGEHVMPQMQAAMYAPQLNAMRAGSYSNDNGALIAEVKALREEVVRLRQTNAQGDMANVQATQQVGMVGAQMSRQQMLDGVRKKPKAA